MKGLNPKLRAIRNVKKKLENVKVQDVADKLKCTRQNIYFHLNEDRADSVSLEHLQKISEAIDEVERDEKKRLASLI
jgi:hypothetical protein